MKKIDNEINNETAAKLAEELEQIKTTLRGK